MKIPLPHALLIACAALHAATTLAAPPAPEPQRTYDQYKILTERNIFVRDRSRSPARTTATTLPPPEETTLILTGIVRRATESVAFVEDRRSGQTRILRVGDSVGDGKLTLINTDRVVLESPEGNKQISLGMSFAGGHAPAPDATPAPAPPASAATPDSESARTILERMRERRKLESRTH